VRRRRRRSRRCLSRAARLVALPRTSLTTHEQQRPCGRPSSLLPHPPP
jgi:hypothetical protein